MTHLILIYCPSWINYQHKSINFISTKGNKIIGLKGSSINQSCRSTTGPDGIQLKEAAAPSSSFFLYFLYPEEERNERVLLEK